MNNNQCNFFLPFFHLQLVDVEKGRKAVGGKIEVLLKIREPFEDKDTEVVKEKWLVLETHLRSLDLVSSEK